MLAERTRRFGWVYSNQFRMYESRTLAEIEAWPQALRHASDILKLAGPTLAGRWGESLRHCGRHTGIDGSQPYSADGLLAEMSPEARRLAVDSLKNPEVLTAHSNRTLALEVSEWIEHTETCMLVGEGIRPGVDADVFELHQLLRRARAVLDKAALTLSRIDHATSVYADGKPIFGGGRRKEYIIQAECANKLAIYFKQVAGHQLLDQVGCLLVATFAETCGTFWRNKTPRDAVRQLLT